VLKDIQKLLAELRLLSSYVTNADSEVLTLVTSEALTALHSLVYQDTQQLDSSSRHRLQKLANAAQKSFAECALLLDENRLLFEQNNESNCRKLVQSTKVGEANVISYNDIIKAQVK
jgi:hypothetical protein